MPKTEAQLQDWVVEYNRHTTHNRDLTSNYGYQAILGVDLVALCKQVRSQFTPPIRVLDIGCGSGWALKQLAEQVASSGGCVDDFEFWGIGLNRYEPMWIPENRFIHGGLNAYDFAGSRFHMAFSVFAFHYMWHKLEGVAKVHNELLFEGGCARLHFPGYLVRFGEQPAALRQNESEGSQRFRDFLSVLEADGDICPMHYRHVPNYSDDDDCTLLAEFGNIQFQKTSPDPIDFGKRLQAFAMFDSGFAFPQMNKSGRIYVASHYPPAPKPTFGSAGAAPASRNEQPEPPDDDDRSCAGGSPCVNAVPKHPYRITNLTFPVAGRSVSLDVAVHELASDQVVVICPGACEPLAGRVVEYKALAESIAAAELGAVVRYDDPYSRQCGYDDFLLEKLRRVLQYTRESASHFCATANPQIHVMAYSSSAGAAAALASEYSEIEKLLLIAPSADVPRERVLPGYRRYSGDVRVLVGESDEVVLPQQAYWYYEQAAGAASREYVEAPSCGHTFAGPSNKSLLLDSPRWAFGYDRPSNFPPAQTTASEPWI